MVQRLQLEVQLKYERACDCKFFVPLTVHYMQNHDKLLDYLTTPNYMLYL